MTQTKNHKQTEISEIPDGWIQTNMGSLVSSVSKTFDFSSVDDVVFLNTGDISEGKVLVHDKISKVGLPGQAKKTIQKGDILLSEIRPRNKRFAFVDFEAQDYVVSTKLMVLRANGNAESKFIYYHLTSEQILEHLQMLAESRSGTFPQITFDEVSSLDINLPQKSEQLQIADFIKTLDDKIELNRRMNKTLEEMGKALFKHWFVDFEFPNENGEPYKSSGGEMVESELGEIPQGWELKHFNDIVTFNTNSVKPFNNPNNHYWHFSIPSFDQNGSPLLELGSEIKSNKTLIKENSILISKLNPKKEKRVWTVFCDSWNGNLISSTEFINIIPDNADWGFINYMVREQVFYDRFSNMSTGSTGSRQRVRPTEFKKFKTIYPDGNVRKIFNDIVSPFLTKIDQNTKEIINLALMRDSLLPRLMSGRLRV